MSGSMINGNFSLLMGVGIGEQEVRCWGRVRLGETVSRGEQAF